MYGSWVLKESRPLVARMIARAKLELGSSEELIVSALLRDEKKIPPGVTLITLYRPRRGELMLLFAVVVMVVVAVGAETTSSQVAIGVVGVVKDEEEREEGAGGEESFWNGVRLTDCEIDCESLDERD